jgi:hypothetical protein
MIGDFIALIGQFQIHHHARRCGKSNGECKYGYSKAVIAQSRIQEFHYLLARSEAHQNIVPDNLDLLTLLRCHHCLEMIHSDQCIGYILKYCSKSSDIHPVGTVIDEGCQFSKKQQLEYDAASRVCSGVECFAHICSNRRHHLSPSVGLLPVYRENKRIVLIHPNRNAEERLNESSPLERYFHRPRGAKSDDLTYTQYFSLFQTTKRDEGVQDECPQPQHIVPRLKTAIFMLKDVCLRKHEKFC